MSWTKSRNMGNYFSISSTFPFNPISCLASISFSLKTFGSNENCSLYYRRVKSLKTTQSIQVVFNWKINRGIENFWDCQLAMTRLLTRHSDWRHVLLSLTTVSQHWAFFATAHLCFWLYRVKLISGLASLDRNLSRSNRPVKQTNAAGLVEHTSILREMLFKVPTPTIV